jgi:hypothetical protein
MAGMTSCKAKKKQKTQAKKFDENDKKKPFFHATPKENMDGFLETETRHHWPRIFDTPSLDRLPTGQWHYRPDLPLTTALYMSP